jgi:formylglycine-generating enzyme required for sulfatase activity/serine/threonine protein kinase
MSAEPTPSPDTPSTAALFATYISQREAGRAVDFDALCASHPSQAAALRRARDEYERAHASELPNTITVDDAISVESIARGAAGESLLQRLTEQPAKAAHYRLDAEIARGGMGAILKVWDENLRRHLAMKVILGADSGGQMDGVALARFLEEAQVTGQLDHPGIVPVHELGLDPQGRIFFTMKLVKGRDLKRIFELVHENREGWNETRALSVILKVCEAMAFAHAKGVIHRDLKPANVMIGNYGEVYVMDWGLARVLGHKDNHDIRIRPEFTAGLTSIHTEQRDKREEGADSPILTMGGDVMGTPAYMPPEQAFGEVEKLSARSDVYAIGAMLYHLLARHMPYVEAGKRVTSRTVLSMVLQGPPAPLHSQRKDIPAELVAICEKAMAREPADRYPDTLKLGDDLRAFLEHRVVTAYETGAFAEAKKWMRRNKGVAVASTAALGALIIGLASTAALWSKAEKSEKIATQKADDVLSLSASKDLEELVARADALWPAHPHNIPAYVAWLDDARSMLDGRKADPARSMKARPSLADHQRKLAELRARALPQTEAEKLADAATHPRAPELAAKRAKLGWTSRMLLRADAPAPGDATLTANESAMDDARELDALAAPLVDPSRDSFGEEARGLALAQRAVAVAGPGEIAAMKMALARAQLANARFDEALATAKSAVADAPADQRAELEARSRDLEAGVTRWRAQSAEREQERSALSAEVAELEALVSARRTWTFSADEDSWWQVQLSELVAGLETFADPDPHAGLMSNVEKRLELARTVEERSVTGAQVARRWTEAIASIRDEKKSPRYRGLVLTPQLGFVPIGKDPKSGLWEFAHVQTGDEPERAADGTLVLRDGTALVFVLIPGGTFLMGAQRDDPDAPGFDPATFHPIECPPHEVSLEPFFLSKYEMTLAQWSRIRGEHANAMKPNPQDPDSPGASASPLLHPVEDVSWFDCSETVRRLGLDLPTEAQWEYATRAGTTTIWWTGDTADSWEGVINIGDRDPADPGHELSIHDGWSSHAPVGVYPPNGFGLHEVLGNVNEWCRDGYGPYALDVKSGDGERLVKDSRHRVVRGGGGESLALRARPASRLPRAPEDRTPWIGLRPACRVQGR